MCMCNAHVAFFLLRVHLFTPVVLFQTNNSGGGLVSVNLSSCSNIPLCFIFYFLLDGFGNKTRIDYGTGIYNTIL